MKPTTAAWPYPLVLLVVALSVTACGKDASGPPELGGAPPLLASWGGEHEGTTANVSGLQVDAEGTLYALDPNERAIQKFGASGAPAGRIRLDVAAVPDIDYYGDVYPRNLVRAADGSFFCVDTYAPRLLHFSATGAYLAQFSAPGDSLGQLLNPIGLARGADDHLFVLDDRRYRVLEFAPTGEFLREFGRQCSDPDGFESPTELSVGPGGIVYVADDHLRRLTRFDGAGAALASIWLDAILPEHRIAVTGVVVGSDGHLFLSEYGSRSVYELSAEGELLREIRLDNDPGYRFAGSPMVLAGGDLVYQDEHGQLWRRPLAGGVEQRVGHAYGSGPAEFDDIHQMVVAPDGTVYILSEQGRRLQEFDATGHLKALWDWQESRQDTSFLPGPLAVDAAGTLFAFDNFKNQIIRLGPGRRFVTALRLPEDSPAYDSRLAQLIVDQDHAYVIVSTRNGVIERYAPDGRLLARLEARLSPPPLGPELNLLRSGPDGEIWGTDERSRQFVRLSPGLSLIGTLAPRAIEDSVRYTIYVRGFAFDPEGNMTVEAFLQPESPPVPPGPSLPGPIPVPIPIPQFVSRLHVLRFDRMGRLLARWDAGGIELYTDYGSPMAFDARGRLFLADTRLNRVFVYGRSANSSAPGGLRP